jgi:hypothetical protein
MDYEIKVRGELDGEWASTFEDMTLTVEEQGVDGPITTLAGPLADQSALRGILNRLWDLNLTLISVHRCSGDRGGL